MVPVVLLSATVGGLTYFLINQLPKKIGYPKFILTCLVYFIFIAAITGAVTQGIINGPIFLILFFLPTPFGALYLKHELMEELKNAFNNK
jgi:hypothetical protein